MKFLNLNNSTKQALVDDEDYERCMMYKWLIHSGMIKRTQSLQVSLSNYIMKNYINIYDHKDRNHLNNQKINLRICTEMQNTHNRRKPIRFNSATSKFKGVCWKKSNKKWVSEIMCNGKTTFLGYFTNEEAAAKAYDQAALHFHGEFAVLNFPTCQEQI
jgi:hypothetical protein